MGNIGLESALILVLVLANGIFAMAEMAVVSARKVRLQQRAEAGSRGARAALELSANPNDFLSTVQIGITMISTLAGAFGGATIASKVAVHLKQFPVLADHSDTIALTGVVLTISYLSLILGELVPKSLALGHAEPIAAALAPPMRFLARIGSPAVRLLTLSTQLVLKLLPVKKSADAPVTHDEIKALIAQGTEHGTFEEAEQEMVEGVFRLGDRRAVELMRPRGKIAALDIESSWEENREVIASSPYSRFPVVEGTLDRLIGVAHLKDIFLAGESTDLRALAKPALVVPERTPALDLLEKFQESGEEMAFVVDEHGGIEGMVTLSNLMEAVVGDLRVPGEETHAGVVQRDDGSWLIEGSLRIHDLVEALGMRELPGDEKGFTTAGGFVLAHLRRIPRAGDRFTAGSYDFEVVDMDRNRVDKIAVFPRPVEPEE